MQLPFQGLCEDQFTLTGLWVEKCIDFWTLSYVVQLPRLSALFIYKIQTAFVLYILPREHRECGDYFIVISLMQIAVTHLHLTKLQT